MINWMIVFSLLVAGNVLLTNGFGALALQRNKNSIVFTFVNSICLACVIILSSVLYNLIYTYLLDPFQLEKLGIIVIILFAGLFNFATLEMIKIASKEMYYYYDTTYSFVINMGLTIGVMLSLNPIGDLLQVLINSAFASLGYILITLIFALVYSRLHNKKVSRIVRPVPITILTMSILAMIIYAITISI